MRTFVHDHVGKDGAKKCSKMDELPHFNNSDLPSIEIASYGFFIVMIRLAASIWILQAEYKRLRALVPEPLLCPP